MREKLELEYHAKWISKFYRKRRIIFFRLIFSRYIYIFSLYSFHIFFLSFFFILFLDNILFTTFSFFKVLPFYFLNFSISIFLFVVFFIFFLIATFGCTSHRPFLYLDHFDIFDLFCTLTSQLYFGRNFDEVSLNFSST